VVDERFISVAQTAGAPRELDESAFTGGTVDRIHEQIQSEFGFGMVVSELHTRRL
jgi:hypothetical protein